MKTPLRLLLVEDSEDDAALIGQELERGGFAPEIVRVEDRPGMEKALDEGAFDIVISDHNLPSFDSLRALALLKALTMDTPFIIVSGSIGEELAVAAMKSGASDYIMKGNLRRLPEAVRRELRDAAARKERRAAETLHREAEERYRRLIEEIPAVTYMGAVEETPKTLFISPQIEAITGYPPSAWVETPGFWMQVLHPEDLSGAIEELRRPRRAGESFVREYRVITKSGGAVWLHDDAKILFDDSGRPQLVRGFIQDITARKEAEAKRREAEEKYRALVEEIPAATYTATIEDSWTMLFISPQIEVMTGFPPALYVQDPSLHLRILHPEDRERVLAELAHTRSSGAPFSCDYRILARDGRQVWLRDEARIDQKEASGQLTLRGFVTDVTQSKNAQETVRHFAFHDRLTDLPNRSLIEEMASREIAAARETDRPVGVILLNIDRFKGINNTLGHANGDRILKECGERFQRALPQGGFLAAIGGDVFAALLPGADAERAQAAARRLLGSLREPFLLGGLPVDVEATAGVALFPGHGEEASVLLQHADVAVFLAKKEGVDLALYRTDRDPHNPKSIHLLGQLRQGIEQGQLLLNYQPKLELQTRKVAGVEALVRWRHPETGMIPPVQFLPMAEQSGLIRPLTRWVLAEAFRQARLWQKEDLAIPIAVNLSARNLHDPALPDQITRLLETWGMAPGTIQMEITETSFLADIPRATEAITRLSRLGISIALDDFGTGYSSLEYLKKLPAREIKIDRSFIMNLASDPEDRVIVRHVIDLAHDLGRKTVAEGIESREIWNLLVEMGCDEAQGYLMARPMEADALRKWIAGPSWSDEPPGSEPRKEGVQKFGGAG